MAASGAQNGNGRGVKSILPSTEVLSQKLAYQVPEDSCGWLCFRPSFLMSFRSPKIYLFFVCCGVTMQGFIINGLINVSITSLERRFSLTSAQAGLIAGTYDIAATLCSVPIAYAGGRAAASKPRWIGIGLIVMGIGSLVFSLPHFFTPEYLVLTQPSESACGAGADSCDAEAGAGGGGDVSRFLYVFLLAQVLHGLGAAPLWSLGVAYIDANVKKKLVSVFLGVYYTMALVGPAIGYLGGSTLLNIHTDFVTVDARSMGLSPGSEGWVGAWWLGFFIASFVTWLAALPVLAFPRVLPQSRDLDSGDTETHGGRDAQQLEKLENKLAEGRAKDLPAAIWGCLTNPTFLCISLAGATDGAVMAGMSTFMPKFIQNQFGLPASQSGLYTGAAALVGGASGTVVGGYLVKRLQLRLTGILKFIAIFSFLSFLSTFVFLASCPNVPFAGVNTPYRNRSADSESWLLADSAARLQDACNSGCGCGSGRFEPICGPDGITYFSACHAGCSAPGATSGVDCRCMDDSAEGLSAPDRCAGACPYLALIVITQSVAAFCTFVGTSPSSTAIFRSVAPRQRPLAMGISTTVLRIVGTIPGPIIFGALIDRSCQLWGSPCSGPSHCLVYDNWWMSRYLMGATLMWKFSSFIFYNLAWIFYKPPEGSEEYPVATVDQGSPAGIAGRPVGSSEAEKDFTSRPEGGLENPAFVES
ncbi:solute carrier organic anion transporter family member 4A1-like isoform X1 [Amphibalanus amphitrite]|uniref:solute carrier organic anion transporter family member 4A1-like isoform X1 n=1 Tax=Amphibalanus amphitrite TaxID=1232801 RepID=UPI001C902940|nr:solute carrier organic anion transporter family member 4A1-like isoform X1 [Amphibalanus amphitrite]